MSSPSRSPAIAATPGSSLSNLVGHDLVTVVTIDREACWRPKSPLEVPRIPRQAGGMPVRRMPLAQLIEHNEQVIRTGGHFWWICCEMLDAGQLGHDDRRDTAADPIDAASTDGNAAGSSGNGREPTAEASDDGNGDGRGDGTEQAGSADVDSRDAAGNRPGTHHLAEDAFRLLGRVTAELGSMLLDQAEHFAETRVGMVATIEAQDVRRAAEHITAVGTRRRIRWQSIDADAEGGA